MENYNNLNDVQNSALQNVGGAVLVTAGAGSGKTKLLTSTISHLIQNKNVAAQNILAITFTNKASKEMKERVNKALFGKQPVFISTFHSFCLQVLRKHIYRLEGYNANFTIYNETDCTNVLKQILKDKKIVDKEKDAKYFSNIMSFCQNNDIEVEEYLQRMSGVIHGDDAAQIVDVCDSYEKALNTNNALDFDRMISKTYQLFCVCEDVLHYYSNLFEYIFIDEFQDTNVIQYKLIKLLCKVHKNIFVVGDEDQCIYTWRGANFENIFNFKKDFENVKVFKLEQNYRSTKQILEKANHLIKKNDERLDKVLWTENEEGKNVEFTEYYDDRIEAENVVQKIIMLNKNGINFNEIAILMRTNAQSLPFEQKLLNYNVPYKIYGGFKFYERAEIKNLLAYLNLFNNKVDNNALTRIINFPKRAMGDVAILNLRTLANSLNKCMLDTVLMLNDNPMLDLSLHTKLSGFAQTFSKLESNRENQSLFEFCESVIRDFNIKESYSSDKDEDKEKLMNIDMFLKSVYEYDAQNDDVTLQNFLESITLESDLDTIGEEENVIISTVHSVKGLEFDAVFVVGIEEGIFPTSRAENNKSKMEEERRLMYVAMTRAKKRLFLSCCKQRFLHGRFAFMQKSRFLGEAKVLKPAFSEYASGSANIGGATHSYMPKSNFAKSSFENTKVASNASKSLSDIAKDHNFDVNKYKEGQTVSHKKFGIGKIDKIIDQGMCAEIIFEGFGKKTLVLAIAPLEIL